MIVLTGKLDVNDEGKTEVMEDPWVYGLISFMDGLPFTESVPLTLWGNGAGEKMMNSALVMLSFSWISQVEKSNKPLAVSSGMLRREIWAGGSYLGVTGM